MPTIEISSQSLCLDCGGTLSSGVCPACAFGQLLSNSGAIPQRAEEAPIDVEFGRYVLKERLAAGGMGIVYAAEDKHLKRTVALKMIRGFTFANEAEVARFTIEAEAAAALDHPNIVPIYEVGMIDDQPFFTMKLIKGESLAQRLKNAPGHRFPPRKIAECMSKIARAVQHAHRRGVLHRDLKPGNVLIDEDGTPWLTDFGLAKLVHEDGNSDLTKTTDHLGTPHYMPPEVVEGANSEVSTASDVWSLGVMLWEALFGKPPFVGRGPVEILRKIVSEEPVKAKGELPDRDLLTLAEHCLVKDPARRLDSAEMFADELDRWMRGEPLKVRRISAGARILKWTRRNPAWAAVIVALVFSGVSGLFLWQRAEKAVDELTDSNDRLGRSLTIATATRLALDARAQVQVDASRALLLAVESVNHTRSQGFGILDEAVSSVMSTLQGVGGVDVSPYGSRLDHQGSAFLNPDRVVNFQPVYSPDGSRLLTFEIGTGDVVTAAVHDVSKGGEALRLSRWHVADVELYRVVAAWVDNERILTIDQKGAIILWTIKEASDETPDRHEIANFDLPSNRFLEYRLERQEEKGIFKGVIVLMSEALAVEVMEFDISVDRREMSNLRVREVADFGKQLLRAKLSFDRKWLFMHTDGEYWLTRLDPDLLKTPDVRKIEDDNRGLFHEQFSQCGNWLAVRQSGNFVRLYQLGDRTTEEALATGTELFSSDSTVELIEFSPDSRWLAAGTKSGKILVASVPERRVVERLSVIGNEVMALCFSEDGTRLAGGSLAKAASVWEVTENSISSDSLKLFGLPTPVMNLKFSPQGDAIVASGIGGHHRHWQLDGGTTGAIPDWLPGSSKTILDLAVSPDGEWVAAACAPGVVTNQRRETGIVKLISTGSEGEYVLGSHEDRATSVAIDRGGNWIASSGPVGWIKVWALRDVVAAIRAGAGIPRPVFELDTTDARSGYDRNLAFHPRGTLYSTCGDGVLFSWDMGVASPEETRTVTRVHSIAYQLPGISFSPDGRLLAVGRHGWDKEPREGWTQVGNMVLLFDVSEPGRLLPVAELPAAFLDKTTLCFSPDNRWLAAGGAGYGAMVWDLQAPDIEKSRNDSLVTDHLMEGIAFSPNGEWLALGGSDGQMFLWDWKKRNGGQRTITTEHSIHSLKWLTNSKLLSGGNGGRVGVWETDLNKLILLATKAAGRTLTVEEKQRFLD